MAENPNFQVDVIFRSVKELQEEKTRNERVLSDLYRQRQQWESKLEEASNKLAVMVEEESRLKEAVELAKQKEEQSETQVKMLRQEEVCSEASLNMYLRGRMEAVNEAKRTRITDLNRKIEETHQMRRQQLIDFEDKMTALTNTFRDAHQFHSDDSLEKESDLLHQKRTKLLEEFDERRRREETLLAKIERAQAEEREEVERDEIPPETWRAVVEMVAVENQASKEALEAMQAKMAPLLEQRDRLSAQLVTLSTTGEQQRRNEE